MKSIAWILTITVLGLCCKDPEAQVFTTEDFQLTALSELPKIITESSGLELAAPDEYWSFNDRNGKAELYKFNSLGELIQTLEISNASNVDWEDITKDRNGNIYIGDFGNNDNERKDLTIYVINTAEIDHSNNKVSASVISFALPDQTAFPPPRSERFYDIEAMFSKGDHLYLLTRDRSKPFVGKTSLYRIPKVPGNYTAEYLEDFITDPDKGKGQVTGADISNDGTVMILLTKEVVWVFRNITGEKFFSEDALRLDLPVQLDMEGIYLEDEKTFFLVNENTKKKPSKLYRLDLLK